MNGPYDFDMPVKRFGTDSIKWKVKEGELPMWVADMDFLTAPEILRALSRRLAHGVFGYTDVTDDWYDAYIGWWKTRHGFTMRRDSLIFCTGVVPAISSAVRKLTTPNENVLILTPVYNVFYNSILNNGARVLESPLICRDGEYSIDFDDLERKLADPQTTLMIFCNPHNPVGKIWDQETLVRVGELAAAHHVALLSDEIHCDLTEPGKGYVPFAAASETCRKISVTAIAPTKAFNLAGIQTAAVYAEDPVLRHKIRRALNTDEVAEPNAFAGIAAVAAFTEGGPWLDELRAYVFENRRAAESYLKKEIPELSLTHAEATYLLWIDMRALPRGGEGFASFLREKTGLYLTDGAVYGRGGSGFLRMNVACPRDCVYDGLSRLKEGVRAFLAAAEPTRNGRESE